MNEDMALFGAAIGFMPLEERLRFYLYREEILKAWALAGYGDPQYVKFALRMTEMRIEFIRAEIEAQTNEKIP